MRAPSLKLLRPRRGEIAISTTQARQSGILCFSNWPDPSAEELLTNTSRIYHLRKHPYHALGANSNSLANLDKFEHLETPLAAFVFRDERLMAAKPFREYLLGQPCVFPCCDEFTQQHPVLRAP